MEVPCLAVDTFTSGTAFRRRYRPVRAMFPKYRSRQHANRCLDGRANVFALSNF